MIAILRRRYAHFLIAAFGCLALQASHAYAQGAPHWVAAWAAAPQSVSDNPAAPAYDRAPTLAHQTVRQIVYPDLSGVRVRIEISNRYGRTPLVVDAAHLAYARPGAAIDPASDRALSFGGHAGVTIPPGRDVISDPAALTVRRGEPLAISFYLAGRYTPATWHKLASQVNYLSVMGDHAADADGAAFRTRYASYLWLSGLAVDEGAASKGYAVVAIGDSITDGMRSTLNANRRWPDDLARRLAERGVAVVNAGISGNRLLSDSPCYGARRVPRFDADALAQPGVKTALVLIGSNDINFAAMPPHAGLDCDTPHTQVDAARLIDGYRQLIAAAHARGVRILGATLTPASLPPARESIRLAANRWIRQSGAFDGVIDFDAALRDPAEPGRLLPRYDSGDHIHPSDAGYAAMAESVPLDLLAPR